MYKHMIPYPWGTRGYMREKKKQERCLGCAHAEAFDPDGDWCAMYEFFNEKCSDKKKPTDMNTGGESDER